MRFRYKVLALNMIVLSIALGFIGYFMINRNFQLALDTQIKNAVLENNLIQSSVEYELLKSMDASTSLSYILPDVGKQVNSGMMSSDSAFYLVYGKTVYYSSDKMESLIPDTLHDNLLMGDKNYKIEKRDDAYDIYVTSINNVNGQDLSVITKSDVTDAYQMMHMQTTYYQILLIVTILICAAIMYILSILLTKPIETLDSASARFAKGEYNTRVTINTKDEIGELAKTFNLMAGSVDDHIKELNDMVKRREQFVADFTHEIKTPMTSIIGYSDMLRSKEMSRETQIIAANYIFSEGKRLESLSMKLFDLIYLNQHEIERTKLSTKQLISEVNETISPALSKKSITLSVDVNDDIIYGDKELLKTAMINLIDNAKKASNPGSSIEITGTSLSSSNYQLRITDHGYGMTKEETEKICDEFYMVDKSRSRKEGGAGLGMSLTSIILSSHKADLQIDSEKGVGTSITITFHVLDEDTSISGKASENTCIDVKEVSHEE